MCGPNDGRQDPLRLRSGPTASAARGTHSAFCEPESAGWRIDYQMASAGLAECAVSAVVEKAADYTQRWSDHAPVTCVFDWDAALVPGRRQPIGGVHAEASEAASAHPTVQ